MDFEPSRDDALRCACCCVPTVTCNLQQKAGAGMVTAAATYGDLATDRVATVKWESEGVQLQVVVFGMAV